MAKKKWTAKDLPNLRAHDHRTGLERNRTCCRTRAVRHGARVILAVRDVDKVATSPRTSSRLRSSPLNLAIGVDCAFAG